VKRLIGLWLLPVCAFASLDVYTVENGVETPVGALLDLGSGPGGDELAVRIRLRNSGKTSELLDYLRIAGVGFTITGAATPPYAIAPGTNYDFHVRFTAWDYGTYSANLSINTRTILVKAAATGTLSVMVDGVPLAAGSSIDFGKIERGKSVVRIVAIENHTPEAMPVNGVTVSGAGFRLDSDIAPPITIAPAEVRSLNITCAPSKSGLLSGSLELNGRTFVLSALAVEPKPPRPLIRLDSAAATSAQQIKLSVLLSETSKANGTGTLKINMTGAKDDALIFVSAGKPAIDFEIREGDQQARFGAKSETLLQTGTTAGTITITADIAGYTDQASIVIPPTPVRVDSGSVVREGTNLVLTANGFDNTRTLGQLAFTFYDSKGALLTASPIRLDAAADFKRFFDSSTLGGMFSLRAVFPVSGDGARIAGVEIEFQNTSGVTRSDKLRF
jgi:hypothetical protein